MLPEPSSDSCAVSSPDPILFSVVIPTYNSSGFVSHAIESVAQSAAGCAFEVLIVDDCSADAKALNDVVADKPYVRLFLSSRKRNAARNRNIGHRLATGKYIFFLDSDDRFFVPYVGHRIALHQKSQAAVVFGNFIVQNASGSHLRMAQPKASEQTLLDYIFKSKGDFRTSTLSVEKNFRRGRVFDGAQKKHQDWGVAARLTQWRAEVQYDARAYVLINETERPGRMSDQMNIPASQYFVKHYLDNPDHIINFASMHRRICVQNRDIDGLKYLYNLILSQRSKNYPIKIKRILLLINMFFCITVFDKR